MKLFHSAIYARLEICTWDDFLYIFLSFSAKRLTAMNISKFTLLFLSDAPL
jgi:hypothetical protein